MIVDQIYEAAISDAPCGRAAMTTQPRAPSGETETRT